MTRLLDRFTFFGCVFVFGLSLASFVRAETPDFARKVLPILSNKCFLCHGPDAEEGELRLDSLEAATADLGGYHAIDRDSPEDSEVLVRIHSEDAPMPPEDADKQLTEAEREILTAWIKGGAEYGMHWAFVPPVKPTPPEVGGGTAPVDAFILDPLQRDGLDLAPEADRATLARRLSLVLIGLPPEPARLEAFLNDTSPDAYEKYVDQLLADPRFGEHQARYWLDAVRYGDTHGLHLDNRRGIYPYRDWVVRAFNENLPFDQFITWQLAGDLLEKPTSEQLIATGFVRMNPTTSEGGVIPAEFQAKNNFDRTETLGTVLLGVSLNCARCHTHKYDPIPHQEYYRLFAFFNSTAESSLDGNKYEYGPTLRVPADQASWGRWQALKKQRKKLLADVQSSDLSEAQATIVSDNETAPEKLLEAVAAKDGQFVSHAQHAAAKKLTEDFTTLRDSFTTTLVARELEKPRETHVLRRGEYDKPMGESLEPDVLSVLGSLPEGAPRNRLGLARWITSRDHPTVARVLVNRIWSRVFGEPLVRTPEDFGQQGEQPTHPELLDWLAVDFQDRGWDHKAMIKQLVMSRTFRQQSAWRESLDDPANRRWARGPRFRLDAEVLRDIGLWSSGLLDPHMGGEGVKPYQPAGMWLAMAHPASNTKKYVRDEGQRLYRRSLYVYWKRTSPHPMMTLFDAPDRESSCVRRSRTNTASQSLGLLNETQRIEMGKTLAERLIHHSTEDVDRLGLLYQLLTSRKPRDVERTACLSLLEQMKKRYEANPQDAAALLNTGDAKRDASIPLVEQAAWTQVAITVLASDAALLLY